MKSAAQESMDPTLLKVIEIRGILPMAVTNLSLRPIKVLLKFTPVSIALSRILVPET